LWIFESWVESLAIGLVDYCMLAMNGLVVEREGLAME
jgi:hypothetical protein